MSFIQCCKEKVYGPKVFININQIVMFEKHIKVIPDEQWYVAVMSNGERFYTLYDLTALSTYILPNF